MPLQLRLKSELRVPIDADHLVPEHLEALSIREIGDLQIPVGNQLVRCGDLFEISGTVNDGELILEGDCRRVKRIGAAMTRGSIRVVGDAGLHVGQRMKAGRIVIEGNAGDWAGAEMSGGLLTIRGDAGHFLGGAYPGSKKGMRGGEIFVWGSAGKLTGQRMRRGLIAVSGRVAEAAGAGMIAGTLCLAGGAGASPGVGMKRGTILIGDVLPRPLLPPTFVPVINRRPAFLNLLLSELDRSGFPVPDRWRSCSFDCDRGDLLELGLGEIFRPQAGSN